MTLKTMYLYFTVLLVGVHAFSIEKVSEKQNVTKRAANGDFFPDWVPFKNKHGDKLGEFQQVAKSKPKKRLAPPVNFILRAVAEPEGDDYYDKGQGESDGEEYFEKKEWSDLHRPAEPANTIKAVNHSDISDIEGVVDIITKGKPSVILEALQQLNNSKKQNLPTQVSFLPKRPVNDESKEEKDEEREETMEETEDKLPYQKKTEIVEEKLKGKKKQVKKPKIYDYYTDYEDGDAEKPKPQVDDQSENDAKKASILDSVDELKERHAEEQRAISEKVKEEEIHEEDHERNRVGGRVEHDKYEIRGQKKVSDYDEYDDKEVSVHEKYRMAPSKTTTTTRRPNSMRSKGKKNEEVGKMSVFKNPHLYMVYDDESEDTTTTKKPTTETSSSSRFSSRYTTSTPEIEENVYISLVPQDNEAKEGEPTLFFPKTRKNKKRRKHKTTKSEPDSSVAESVTDTSAKELTTALDVTGPSSLGSDTTSSETGTTASGFDTTVSGSASEPSGLASSESELSGSATSVSAPSGSASSESIPTGTDSASTNTNSVTDAVPASTDHKEEKKREDFHDEKGGGHENHSEHSEEHEEHGKKAYEGTHKDSKTAKGHHDKEDHLGKYEDKGGHDKHHHEESGHYGDHDHEEHGKKQAKYEETGKHSKGHSTKGSHDIHKKEEYEKKVEFFEEEGDSAEEEKHGGYNKEREHKAGGHFTKGNLQAAHHQHHKGDAGHFQKGGHSQIHLDHRKGAGHDGYGKHAHTSVHNEGGAAGKKWVYHHGYPAKTSNLVIIDRRADQLYHGPQYYG